MTKPAEAVTVVIPVHNAADRLDRVAGWRMSLEKSGRDFEIIVVDDGSTESTAEKLPARAPHTRVVRHESRRGFGACLRSALAETRTPLFFYTALDYPYTPGDIKGLLERINVKDDYLGKQPDLVSGCRTGMPTPFLPRATGYGWRLFWRAFAGMPMQEGAPWHGWGEFWYKVRVGWIYAVPLADVNSCFKLFRTAFLRRFPIQSDGDFVHTELVAKATFLTSIMDEVALTPKPDPIPPLGSTAADSRRVFRDPQFTLPDGPPQSHAEASAPPAPVANEGPREAGQGSSDVPTSPDPLPSPPPPS
jgi:glycosyltransferase involved in cell wall biosynthesis